MKKERTKTMSKHFYDDEILFKDENGDIHLKDGIQRTTFQVLMHDPQINYFESAMKKIDTFKNNNKDWD